MSDIPLMFQRDAALNQWIRCDNDINHLRCVRLAVVKELERLSSLGLDSSTYGIEVKSRIEELQTKIDAAMKERDVKKEEFEKLRAYCKPAVKKVDGMSLAEDVLDAAGRRFSCRSCSSCHGCR